MSERSGPPRVLVRLITHNGLLEYGAVVLDDDGNHVVVQAEFAETAPHDLGFVVLELGDIWTEHYWRDRWYSVKAISTASGAFKGWYCDAARPAEIDGDVLVSVDLELDLWVSPDRSVIIRLDEDEFRAFGVPERDPFAAAEARHAIDDLERLAKRGEAPFEMPSPPT
jgi:predicted RNA-binding protein associated with RNAse of E/G family